MKKYWIIGIIITLATISLVIYEYVKPKKMPLEGLIAAIPVDSNLVQNKYLLTEDRKGNLLSALQFDGVKDYVMVDSAYTDLKTDFTFSFWMKSQKIGVEHTLFIKGENCPDGSPNFKGMAYEILLSKDNIVLMKLFAPNGNHSDEYIQMVSDKQVSTNQWHFIAISFDNVKKRFNYYINGEPSFSETVSKTKPENFIEIHQTVSSFKIGADENYCGYIHQFGNFYKGQMDEILLYNRVLDSQEIAGLGGFTTWPNYLKMWMILYFITILILALLQFKTFTIYSVNKIFTFYRRNKNLISNFFYAPAPLGTTQSFLPLQKKKNRIQLG